MAPKMKDQQALTPDDETHDAKKVGEQQALKLPIGSTAPNMEELQTRRHRAENAENGEENRGTDAATDNGAEYCAEDCRAAGALELGDQDHGAKDVRPDRRLAYARQTDSRR